MRSLTPLYPLSVKVRRWRFCRQVLLGLLLPASLFGQMVPDAPIKNFRLPMFGQDGYKTWELRGLEGIYLNETESLIKGLELITFTGGIELNRNNIIRSPQALINFTTSTAKSESSLFMIGPNFEIQGSDWFWDARKDLIRVNQSARVTFSQSLDILK